MALWSGDLGGVDLMSLHFPPRVGCRLLNREGYELVGPNYDSLSCMLPSAALEKGRGVEIVEPEIRNGGVLFLTVPAFRLGNQ